MSIAIEKLPLPPLELGEGPHWDVKTQSLFVVDILVGKVYKYYPATNQCSSFDLGPAPVSFIIPIEGETNKFIISSQNTLKFFTWEENVEKTSIKTIVNVEDENSQNRINDGKCDPVGRLWTGTMGTYEKENHKFSVGKGSLYSFDPKDGVRKHLSSIGISNGLAWNLSVKKFYYVDSLTFKIFSYDYNEQDGKISKEKVVFDFKKEGKIGFPDGMTIDEEGKLWTACFEGGKVLRIDPENGNIISELEFPSFQITSVAFGGKYLDELYVTSADLQQTSETKEKYPQAGCTFRVTGLGVKGLPMANFRNLL